MVESQRVCVREAVASWLWSAECLAEARGGHAAAGESAINEATQTGVRLVKNSEQQYREQDEWMDGCDDGLGSVCDCSQLCSVFVGVGLVCPLSTE